MALGGTFGRALVVDVTDASSRKLEIHAETHRRLIGGVGLGTHLLLQVSPSEPWDALDPSSPVVFSFGPLVGTPLTTSAKFAVVAKSPLTDRLNDALSSSHFALAGKRTGHDALIVIGKAARPSVLLIDDDRITVVSAAHLWNNGAPIADVEAQLKEDHPGFVFATIGLAGERAVRFASLSSEGRHAGRGGLGAVLGAKNIKAVGVRGSHRVPIADPQLAIELSRDLARRSLGEATEKYRTFGTIANLATFNRLHALPVDNFQHVTTDQAPLLTAEQLHETRSAGRSSCANCTIGCGHFFKGDDAGAPVKLEYETLFALGPLCGVNDPDAVLAAARACDQLGLDTISAGGTIALALELRRSHGLPTWARDASLSASQLPELLSHIAHRDTPLGDALAEGSRHFAERVGPAAARLASHVKGLEMPGYEPRTLQTMALGLAVSSRGADHNRSGAYDADFRGETDRFAGSAESARHVVESEDRAAVIDSLILCKFLRGVFRDYFGETAILLTAITGEQWSESDLRAAASNIADLKKAFNQKHGWTRAEDTLPARILETPVTLNGREVSLTRETLTKMIDAYYDARGWTPTGRLPPDRCQQLNIVAPD